MTRWVLTVLLATPLACGGSNTASNLLNVPSAGADLESKCSAAKPDPKPLVVALPAGDKATLEAAAKSGPLILHYAGCTLEALPRCHAREQYKYTGTTLKKDNVAAKNLDELYAKIPVGALNIAGKLQTHGSISVAMAIVGRFAIEGAGPDASELEGDCEGATHWATAITVGAYRMAAGADADIETSVNVLTASVGGESSASRDLVSEDGNAASCANAQEGDAKPPHGCGAILRVELAALRGKK